MLREIIFTCFFALLAANALVVRNSNPDNAEANYRLPNHTRPLFYDLKLNPHLVPNNFTFDGEVFIHIEITRKTNTLTLHAKKLLIDENKSFLKSGLDFYVPFAHDRDTSTDMLNLHFDEELVAGYYVLHLKFSGVLSDRPYGFYRSSYINDAGNVAWFAVTNFMGTDARAAFPCWDEPALKATFKIAIKHHRNHTAVSNMPVSDQSKIDESDGKIWTHFQVSPVISTYSVGFLVSDFRNTSNSDGTVSVWSRGNAISSANFALDVAKKAAIELERYTNGSVRLAKIDHVALPSFYIRTTKSWGLITYREAMMLHDRNSPIDRFYRIVENIVQQSTYQWFGNVVSPSWWTSIWLNDGLAEYFSYYFADKICKDSDLRNWRFTEWFSVRTLNLILITESFRNIKPLDFVPNTVEEIDSKFTQNLNKRKAALFLRMLSHCVSDDVFHAGLLKYLKTHKYGVADPEDLWAALQDTLDESTVPIKFPIQEVMDSWIRQKGYPLVTVISDPLTNRTKITQEYFQPYEKLSTHENIVGADNANKKWWVPINFATRSNPNFTSTLATHWLSPDAKELVIEDIDPEDWIIINIQQIGFYRVNYDTANWLKIADYLDSESYTKIHALNRAQIINDAIYLVLSDKLDPRLFMEITRYLRRETDYIAWYPLFEILGDVGKYFAYNGAGELFNSYVFDSMNKLIDSVGTQDRPYDDYLTKLIRHRILKKTCALDHPVCLREAHDQLIAYLENSMANNSLPSYKKDWIFYNGIKIANETTWNKLFYMYRNHSEPLVYCLGQSKNKTIIEKFLNMTIAEEPIEPRDIIRVLYSVLDGGYPNIDIAMEFVINHWDKLTTIFMDNVTELLYNVNLNLVSSKHIQKAKAFLHSHKIEIPKFIKLQEQNLPMIESVINNIRSWLEHRSSHLPE